MKRRSTHIQLHDGASIHAVPVVYVYLERRPLSLTLHLQMGHMTKLATCTNHLAQLPSLARREPASQSPCIKAYPKRIHSLRTPYTEWSDIMLKHRKPVVRSPLISRIPLLHRYRNSCSIVELGRGAASTGWLIVSFACGLGEVYYNLL